jgi:serine/threonine-protein kinase
LLAELGQGGTATVHVASVSGPGGFNKLVVLKRMKGYFAGEPGFSEMFMTEARLAAKLNHPNIVQTNEVFEEDGLPTIVMEYLEGKSLADIAAARTPDCPFTLQHYLTAISEALSGLHYSHELTDLDGQPLELVHRDVTPHNLFVTYAGQVKILDFGIAKLNDSTVETETGIVKGKLRYIPPEQMVGDRLDRRADIYSVGVILWEAAVGEKMWRGLGDAAVMNRVINEQIPKPSQHDQTVDPRLEALIVKALSADPEARQQTALELQQELDAVRKAMPGLVTPRELGPALQAMFASDRAKTRAEVERRLAEAPPLAEVPAAPQAAGTATSLGGVSTRSSSSSRLPALLWALGAAVVLAAVLLAWPTRDQQVVSSTTTTAPRSEPVTTVARRGVRVTVFPQSAELVIDGKAVKGNPFSATMEVDDEEHVVDVTAAGYEKQTRTFTLAEDVDLVVHMRPLPQPTATSATPTAPQTAAPPPKPPVRSRKPEAPKAAEPANPECTPPYIVDERGIKRFKFECLK